MTVVTRRTLFSLGLVAGTGWAVTACSSQSPLSESSSSSGSDGGGTAITHVHAITRDTATGVILLATHQGLFLLENKELTQVGPTVDLMGFTSTGGGRYLASGHPGPGVDLPEPLGLVESTNGGQTWSVLSRAGESDFHALTAGPDRILAFDGQLRTSRDGRIWETGAELPEPLGLVESTDGGQTWSVLSRAGESDFHALTAGPDRILAFDGQLRTSTDGRNWKTLAIPSAPMALAIAPSGGATLATTEEGLLRSTDGGVNWTSVDTPQLMSLVAWADDHTVVGAGPGGRLLISDDSGQTWTATGETFGEVTALGASMTGDGAVETLLVAGSTVLRITDGGNTVEQLL